jgi:hypothetical protein
MLHNPYREARFPPHPIRWIGWGPQREIMMADLLERMRRNPAGDWSIRDVERLCRTHGWNCIPPLGGGSHYKVSHANVREILTIPARRPIKPVYIRRLVHMIEAMGEHNG